MFLRGENAYAFFAPACMLVHVGGRGECLNPSDSPLNQEIVFRFVPASVRVRDVELKSEQGQAFVWARSFYFFFPN